MSEKKILLGNAFPLALIRRKVVIEPKAVEDLKRVLADCDNEVISFWGHNNTLHQVCDILNYDIKPKYDRPAVELNDANLPELEGTIFTECWIISPDYVSGLRPQIGEEIPSSKIIGWHILKITWK